MNLTLDKKKCIYIVIWLLIGILSFTVLELTAATTATSALITLLPGDIGTPIAEKVADLSGYLLIVLCAVFLEKYLVTITGYAAFKIFVPAACVLFAANIMARNRSIDKLARRLLIFGICIFLVVPASVKNSVTTAVENVTISSEELVQKVQNSLNHFVEAVAVMLITSCVIPLLVLFVFFWLIKVLLDVDISGENRMSGEQHLK